MSDFKRDEFFDEFDLVAARRRIDEATGGPARCPYCDGTNWMTELRTERTSPESFDIKSSPAFVMKDPRSHWGPSPAMPAVALTCMNCGNIRLHNYSWVMRPKDPFEEGPEDE